MSVRAIINGILMIFFILPSIAFAGNRAGIGTYSSLYYNEEAGDLLGIEVSFIQTSGGLMASVQVADDGINELHVVEVKEKANNIFLFLVRLDSNEIVDFSMKCTPKYCKGTYKWWNTETQLVLRKSNGYWNSPKLITAPPSDPEPSRARTRKRGRSGGTQ